MNVNLDPAKRIAEIDNQTKALKRDLEKLAEERAELEQEVLTAFVDTGIDSIRVTPQTDGDVPGRKVLVHLTRKVVGRHLQGPEATAQAVIAAGHGDIVKHQVHPQSLNSLIKELMSLGGLPEEFDGVVEPFEVVRVATRLA